jgi:hypothetical protein
MYISFAFQKNVNAPKKKVLITADELNRIGSDINIVGTFNQDEVVTDNQKYASPVVLNYVEPYDYFGVQKTLFFTEVNTNINEGDRVFIINGNYDSDLLIKKDKYKKGRDGYKVLYVDYCKIVLDIDYTGLLPNTGKVKNRDNMSDYIKLYCIDDEESFLSANREITTRSGNFDHKFQKNQNNIAFIKDEFSETNDWGYNLGVVDAPGFFVKDGPNWNNITEEFFNSGSFSQALSPNYYNNGKLKVIGKTFTYNDFEFKNGNVYIWDQTSSTWKIDITEESQFSNVIITKGNFRDGDFTGKFNCGVYGSKLKRIKWTGEATWNGGTLLNSSWVSGEMYSKIRIPISYKSTFNQYNAPYQKVNTVNNGGYGFNFIIDSTFEKSSIYSAIIRNTNFGSTPSLSVVENHIMSYQQDFDNTINNASFESCDFSNIHIVGGTVKNSRSLNSKFTSSKLINSQFKDCVVRNSVFISDSIIKIDDYDEWNHSEKSGDTEYSLYNEIDYKVYKFYIGEADFLKLRHGDYFYIKGLKIKNGSKDVLNFFDKKFRIGSWTEYLDHFNNDLFYKRGLSCAAFLCSPEQNEWIYNTVSVDDTNNKLFYTETVKENPNPQYSIDIFFPLRDVQNLIVDGLNFNYGTQSYDVSNFSRSDLISYKIDISNAFIIDSNFESGIFENSDWYSGNNINLNNDLTIKEILNTDTNGIEYSISTDIQNSISVSKNTLNVDLKQNYSFLESHNRLRVNDVVFLNNIDYDTRGKVLDIIISDFGSGYGPENGLTTSNIIGNGYGLTFDITTNSGSVDSVTIVNNGLNYSIGDKVRINYTGNVTSYAIIEITKVDNNVIRLNDSYIVDKITTSTTMFGSNTTRISLNELLVGTSSSIIMGLTAGGRFKTADAKNRWNYLTKTKINKSKIKSGILRRSYITQSLIENDDYDSNDKDYNNLSKIRNLVISDSIFSNNNNILSSATYINSIFLNGTDKWSNGIIQNSLINGITFNKGTIKESAWIDGIFNGGLFYNSKTFNAQSGINNPYYYSDNIKSYFVDGIPTSTNSNNRFSWRNGTFNGGEFFKSDWENGIFNDGFFYNSKFYNGIIKGGIIGNNNTSTSDTVIYNGVIDYTTVDNANLYTKSTAFYGTTNSIVWNDGQFNKGVFGSETDSISNNSAIWNNGTFNGGQFVSNAVWKNGIFNGGKFISSYGWTVSGSYSISGPSQSYSWQNGKFNGGEFGNANGLSNSTWFTGEFNDGVFQGRVWNGGVFRYGQFNGSSTYSAVGGIDINTGTQSNAINIVNSYTQSFYGLWRGGYVTDQKDLFTEDRKFYTDIERSISPDKKDLKPIFQNMIWKSGIFDNPNGEFKNSLWLGGIFKLGTFKNSSFNPYVNVGNRFDFNNINTTWENGKLIDSDFYYSNWESGDFISGTAIGMVFKNGTSYYMNAYNVFWENGIWKNGNWFGSQFDYNGKITNDFVKKILNRNTNTEESGKGIIHIWNIFKDEFDIDQQLLASAANNTIETVIESSTTPGIEFYPNIEI